MVLCCFFVHLVFNADLSHIQIATPFLAALMYLVQGITLLFYPVLGLVADLKCNRYNFVKVSIVLLFISSLLMMVFISVILALSIVSTQLVDPIPPYVWPILAVTISFVILSLGMFDAVGIQFGMDQMVEASSDQISAFTHWYYWSMNIGIGVSALLLLCILPVLSSCIFHVKSIVHKMEWQSYLYGLIPVLVLQTAAVSAAWISLFSFKGHLSVLVVHSQSLYHVHYKVLKYAL